MGLFDRDKLLGGERMAEVFKDGENFILYDLACISESVPMKSGEFADKSELIVSKVTKDGKMDGVVFKCGTLSKPIAAMAKANLRNADGKPVDTEDLPAIVHWTTVPTPNYEQDATVLNFQAPAAEPMPKDLPAFTLPPITTDDNPL